MLVWFDEKVSGGGRARLPFSLATFASIRSSSSSKLLKSDPRPTTLLAWGTTVHEFVSGFGLMPLSLDVPAFVGRPPDILFP